MAYRKVTDCSQSGTIVLIQDTVSAKEGRPRLKKIVKCKVTVAAGVSACWPAIDDLGEQSTKT